MAQHSPSRREQQVSAGILLLLGLLMLFIYQAQFDFNPAVRLKLEQLDKPHSQPVANALFPSFTDLPLQPLTPPEQFTADNLADKINGKAAFYLSAGFKQLVSRRYQHQDHPEQWLEIFLYEMGSSENSFAVFSSQKRPDAQPISLGDNAYLSRNALFISYGSHYIELIATHDTPQLITTAQALAQQLITQLPKNEASPEALQPQHAEKQQQPLPSAPALFPAENKIADSLSLLTENVFGFAVLQRIYISRYHNEPTPLTAFISARRDTAVAAQVLLDSYRQTLLTYGATPLPLLEATTGPAKVHLVEIMGSIEYFFRCGPFIAGVHDAPNHEQAEQLGKQLRHHLQEALNGCR